jgi:hypothetical protein
MVKGLLLHWNKAEAVHLRHWQLMVLQRIPIRMKIKCLISACDGYQDHYVSSFQFRLYPWSHPIRTDDGHAYKELVEHHRVVRVVALLGGYSRDEANEKLKENDGMIANFSRALAEEVRVNQSSEEFD